MKKNILILLTLIGFTSCSNGQNKQATKDYSSEIIGCWELYDVRYEIKSNCMLFDSISLMDRTELVEEIKRKTFISKFFINGIVKDFQSNGTRIGYDRYYATKGDSLISQSKVRLDVRGVSKISINNDTLYIEVDVFREINRIYKDLRWEGKAGIPDDVKIEVAKMYSTLIRVHDCDQYEE